MTQGQYIEAELVSDLVPEPVAYSVLLPPEYDAHGEPLPLCLFLHGGGGSRRDLQGLQPLIAAGRARSTLPPMVVASLSAGDSLFMDFRDGSERWDSLIQGPWLAHLRSRYRVQDTAAGTLLMGLSMGGHGVLRMAFAEPERFHAVAALEPGIDAALAYADVLPETRFWRSQELLEKIYGSPVDADYWADTNPATLAVKQAGRIRASGLAILLEAGDQDFLDLHLAAESLHRLLWDRQIPHEYHSIRWANHVGSSLQPRMLKALEFLGASLASHEPEKMLQHLRRQYLDFKNHSGAD